MVKRDGFQTKPLSPNGRELLRSMRAGTEVYIAPGKGKAKRTYFGAINGQVGAFTALAKALISRGFAREEMAGGEHGRLILTDLGQKAVV